jgi:fructose-1,6-bisphosphatase I
MDLNEHLIKSGISNELSELMLLIAGKCVEISQSFQGKRHLAGSENVYGEKQVALDKHANDLLIKAIKEKKLASKVASEEEEGVVDIPGGKNFSVVLDPVDGCSSIAVNLTVGTIVGIFEGSDVLQKGENMKAAIVVLYGPLTVLSYSVGKGVHEFVLNSNGFNLKEENLKMPRQGKILASGGLRKDFLPNHLKFIQSLENEGYKIRYSGSYVADMYQIMHKGGLYCYPKLKNKDKGKL